MSAAQTKNKRLYCMIDYSWWVFFFKLLLERKERKYNILQVLMSSDLFLNNNRRFSGVNVKRNFDDYCKVANLWRFL